MRGSAFDIQTMATPASRQDSSTDYISPVDAFVMHYVKKKATTKKNKTKQNNKDNSSVLKQMLKYVFNEHTLQQPHPCFRLKCISKYQECSGHH